MTRHNPDNGRASLIQQEYARHLGQLQILGTPFADRLGLQIFVSASDVSGYAKPRRRPAVGNEVIDNPIVAIRGLDEDLGLVLGINAAFAMTDGSRPLAFVNRQIAVERKALPVETRPHEGQHYRRRAYEWHHTHPGTLCYGHDIRTRICYGRTSGLGNHAHGIAFGQRTEICRYCFGRRMLVEFVENQRINVNRLVRLLQETTLP